jgi:hypothetical protein
MVQDISFDPLKSQRNELKRGLPFLLVLELEWGTALIKEDLRKANSREVSHYEQTQNPATQPRH